MVDHHHAAIFACDQHWDGKITEGLKIAGVLNANVHHFAFIGWFHYRHPFLSPVVKDIAIVQFDRWP
jgi:hypothetical protein